MKSQVARSRAQDTDLTRPLELKAQEQVSESSTLGIRVPEHKILDSEKVTKKNSEETSEFLRQILARYSSERTFCQLARL